MRFSILSLLGLLAAFALPRMADSQDNTTTENVSKRIAVMDVSGPISEARDPLALFATDTMLLRELTDAIAAAAEDPEVSALAIHLRPEGLGTAQAGELHDAIMAFRESGKQATVFLEEAMLGDYLVASAADEIVLTPAGNLLIFGLAMHFHYFRDMLGKLGIETQAVGAGKYKSALEPLTHQEMTEPTREQMTTILDDLEAAIVERVAAGRAMEPEATRQALWNGPYTSTAALDAGLVTKVEYASEYLEKLAQDNGWEIDKQYLEKQAKGKLAAPEPMNLFSLFSGMSGKEGKSRKTSKKRVAVVYALGPIFSGSVENDPFAVDQVIASEDFIDMIDQMVEDGPLAAMVLRVDSPGGSALASDLIWRHLEKVQEREGFPIVASFGNVAASGGYYISMGADKIVAEPETITGSIGVISGRLVIGDTYDKIGVNQQMLSRGPNAGLVDETRPWNEEEAALIRALIDDLYDRFVEQAARGRGMERDALHAAAQGRVWTGRSAKEQGLVDELGGLEKAIELARELGKAPNAELVIYPRELSFFEYIEKMLFEDLGLAVSPAMTAGRSHALPAGLQPFAEILPRDQALAAWAALRLLRDHPGQAHMLYVPNFELK